MRNNWKTYKLGELYKSASGLSKSSKEFGFGNPFVTFKNVFYNYFLPYELDSLVNTNDKEIKSCSVKKGDVFLTRTSETLNELGMSSVALKDYPNATFNGFCKRLRILDDTPTKIDPVFFGFYLRSYLFRNEVTKLASITTRASLNNDAIYSISVTLPDFDEQIEIGKILKSINNKIENNLAINKTLEEMAMALYKHWFVDFGPFQDGGFVESEIFGINNSISIPNGFQILDIKQEIKRLKPKNKYTQNNVLKEGKIRVFDQSSSRFLGCHNNSPDFKADFENPLLIFGDHTCRMELICEDFSVGPNLIPFRTNLNEYAYLVYLALKDKVQMNDYKRHWSELMLHQFIVPVDIDILKDFNNLIKEFFNLINKNEIENQTLTQLRGNLLPKLISGEVRLKEFRES